jgi:ABC-type spermidine/putrescine transport system permease subunit I
VNPVLKALRAFGLFWVDFFVGEAPELFLGTLLAIGAAFLFRHDRPVGITVVLVVVVLTLVASTLRGRQRG